MFVYWQLYGIITNNFIVTLPYRHFISALLLAMGGFSKIHKVQVSKENHLSCVCVRVYRGECVREYIGQFTLTHIRFYFCCAKLTCVLLFSPYIFLIVVIVVGLCVLFGFIFWGMFNRCLLLLLFMFLLA